MSTLHSTLGARTFQVDDEGIKIYTDPDAKTDEGNFRRVELLLSLAGAAAHSEEPMDQSPLEATLYRLDKLFGLFGGIWGKR